MQTLHRGMATRSMTWRWRLMFDEIEPAGRIRHAPRREVVVNGCSRGGSGLADNALRVERDRDKVSARSRRIEAHPHRVAALPGRPWQADTVGVKHVAPMLSGR